MPWFPFPSWTFAPLLWVLAPLTAGLMILTDLPVRTSHGRLNPFDLASARGKDAFAKLLKCWGPGGACRVRLSLYIDFAFIPAYSTFLALLCAAIAHTLGGGWRCAGLAMAWLPWVAAVTDVAENRLLLQLLGGNVSPRRQAMASWLIFIKFLLVGVAGLYVLLTLGPAILVQIGKLILVEPYPS